jgi:hypothetical protein
MPTNQILRIFLSVVLISAPSVEGAVDRSSHTGCRFQPGVDEESPECQINAANKSQPIERPPHYSESIFGNGGEQ